MQDVRIDDQGRQRCWNCGGQDLHSSARGDRRSALESAQPLTKPEAPLRQVQRVQRCWECQALRGTVESQVLGRVACRAKRRVRPAERSGGTGTLDDSHSD